MILANLLTKVQGIEEIIQKLGQIGLSKQKKGRVSLLVKVTNIQNGLYIEYGVVLLCALGSTVGTRGRRSQRV